MKKSSISDYMQQITTKNYEHLISQVFVDDRENKRVDYVMEQYAPFNPSKKHLDIGDYIFIGSNGVKVVVEYKTGSDFLNSITSEDNHLHNQTWEMITNFNYSFIIVETMDLKRELDSLYYATGRDISLSQINGAITTFNTVSTVLFAQTQYQAFDMLMRQAGKIIEMKPLRYKYGKKSTNWALNILSGMKGIEKIAENIVNTLDLHTLNDVMCLTKEELLTVNLVGDKTADKILNNIGRYNDISTESEQNKLSE